MRSNCGRSACSVVILGAGGNVADVLDIVDALKDKGRSIHVRGLLDDHRPVGSNHFGIPVLGSLSAWKSFRPALFLSSIRNVETHRETPEIIRRLGIESHDLVTLVDPRAAVSKRSSLGAGVYICSGASVAAGVSIGDHVSLGPGAIVGHETVLEDHAIICAGALIGGRVSVRKATYVGSGASIKPEVTLGEGSLVGLGAVVTRSVNAGHVVAGNPAITRKISAQ